MGKGIDCDLLKILSVVNTTNKCFVSVVIIVYVFDVLLLFLIGPKCLEHCWKHVISSFRILVLFTRSFNLTGQGIN